MNHYMSKSVYKIGEQRGHLLRLLLQLLLEYTSTQIPVSQKPTAFTSSVLAPGDTGKSGSFNRSFTQQVFIIFMTSVW